MCVSGCCLRTLGRFQLRSGGGLSITIYVLAKLFERWLSNVHVLISHGALLMVGGNHSWWVLMEAASEVGRRETVIEDESEGHDPLQSGGSEVMGP